jgi:hypothetical protein
MPPIARVNQHPPAHHEEWDGKWPRNSFLLVSSLALAKSGWLAQSPFLVPTYKQGCMQVVSRYEVKTAYKL